LGQIALKLINFPDARTASQFRHLRTAKPSSIASRTSSLGLRQVGQKKVSMTLYAPVFLSSVDIIGLLLVGNKLVIRDGTVYLCYGLSPYMATFFGVPGFKYEFKASFEVQEALKMIGM
jgi:hypothetical protein